MGARLRPVIASSPHRPTNVRRAQRRPERTCRRSRRRRRVPHRTRVWAGRWGRGRMLPAMWLFNGRRRTGWGILSATVTKPLVQFALAGVLALVVLSTILTLILDQTGLS